MKKENILGSYSPYMGEETSAADKAAADNQQPFARIAPCTLLDAVPQQLLGAKIATRFECLLTWKTSKGASVTTMMEPGTIVPAYRRSGRGWLQVPVTMEMRAFSLPFYDGKAWILDKEKPGFSDFEDFMATPTTKGSQIAKPGGYARLRSHPEVPGFLPMKSYVGASVEKMLTRAPLQAQDFLKVFGNMPINTVKKDAEMPFRFVRCSSIDDTSEIHTPMASVFQNRKADSAAVMATSGSWAYDLSATDLPVSFAYGEECTPDFESGNYKSGVHDYLKDDEFIFLQHCTAPYKGYTLDVETATERVDREHLAPGMVLTDWNCDPAVSGALSVSPFAYGNVMKFASGAYVPMGA